MTRTIPIVAAAAGAGAGAERHFPNYTQIASRLPAAAWWSLRALVLAATAALVPLLLIEPALGLRLFWGLAIPIVPALLVVAPGLWRQLCPMAMLNQLPRSLGRGHALDLPERWKTASFPVAVGLFVLAVALRQPWLNHDGAAVAALIAGVLMLALVGGWWFKGRSGWCGTFCPLGPIQRTYGQAPLVLVRNGYCEPCVGCQKNCYDFNPRAAVFSDLEDDDPRHAGQRRLFMGLLPGLLLGYFGPAALGVEGQGLRLAALVAGACASAGLYALLAIYLPLGAYRVALGFGALAIAVFYLFAGPVIVGTVSWLVGVAAPGPLVEASRASGVVLALALAAGGWISERRWREVAAARAATRIAVAAPPAGADARARLAGGRSLKDRLHQSPTAEVTDRETGISFQAVPGGTLLESIERAGLKIGYGCRAGVCGADPVLVCDGAEHLSPAGADEQATLRRLGLDGRARLACMCVVAGPVVIDRDARKAAAPRVSDPSRPRIDRAAEQGVRRVVVVGNGIAGMSAAEALRRESESVEITIVANEPHAFYNRMGIGRLVYDDAAMASLELVPDDWAQTQRIQMLTRTVAARIDRDGRRLGVTGGHWLPYDRLVLATGARATLPETGFLDRDNAFVLRSADDAESIRERVQSQRLRRAVVLGGGVLGVEAAEALHKLGLRVTLLQRADRLMNAQLDERGAAVLAHYLESIGIQVVTGVAVDRWDGEASLTAAWLAHGPRVRADLFVACLGIQPNVHLAEQGGLEVRRGIVVDDRLRTADPAIYAIGDCAELPGAPQGLWPVAAAQSAVAVDDLLGGTSRFEASTPIVQLKSDGIDVRSLGEVVPQAGDEVLEPRGDSAAWWRLVLRGGRLVGALYVGPPGSSKGFVRLVQDPQALSDAAFRLRGGVLPDDAA